MLETEITYGATCLPEAFETVASRCEQSVRPLFKQAGLELAAMSGASAAETWEKALAGYYPASALKPQDHFILTNLGRSLGRSDCKDQVKHLRLTMEQIAQDLALPLYEYALLEFSHLVQAETEIENINERLTETKDETELDALINRQHSLRERYEDGGGLTFRSRTRAALLGLGFTEEEFGKYVNTLSGGQKTRIALGKLLLSKPDIILLDEPTNHLDLISIAWLETFLLNYSGAVVVVAHDRYFLDKVVTKVIEVDNAKAQVYEGNFRLRL
jgi:ATPase subunit of ABC transporter with duplicated ATPase domains